MSPRCFRASRLAICFDAKKFACSNKTTVDGRPISQRCPRRFSFTGLGSVIAGMAFLTSAVSEYAFDIDFPLTPSLWMIIALSALVLCLFQNLPAVSSNCADDCSHLRLGRAAAQADHCRSFHDIKIQAGKAAETGDVCLEQSGFSLSSIEASKHRVPAATEVVLSVSFLNPASIRGPPNPEVGQPTFYAFILSILPATQFTFLPSFDIAQSGIHQAEPHRRFEACAARRC